MSFRPGNYRNAKMKVNEDEDDEDDGIIEITTEAKSKPFVYAGLGGSKPAPPLFKQELNAKLQNGKKTSAAPPPLPFRPAMIHRHNINTKFEEEILFLGSRTTLASVDCSNVTGLQEDTINSARNHSANFSEFPIVADNAII